MGEHAKLSPSSAKRWLTCTASVAACEGLEDKSSSYAEEGTTAHAYLEQALKAMSMDGLDFTGQPDDMRDAVLMAFDYVAANLMMSDHKAVLITETKVGPGKVLGPSVWGTADVLVYLPRYKTLHVIDYKHGAGVPVDVEDNPQLEIYAILALEAFSWMFGEISEVKTTVVQPRAKHGDGCIRSHSYGGFGEQIVDMSIAIETINEGQGVYLPSEDACRWCKAKDSCPALRSEAMKAAQMTFAEVPKKEEAENLEEDDLLLFFEKRKLIDLWLKALDARLKDDLMAGKQVGDLKVVAGRLGNRKWAIKDEEELAKMMQKKLKLKPKEFTVKKMASPTVVGKVLDAKAPRNKQAKLDAFEEMITRSEGKPTVVAGDNPKPSIVPQFADLTQETE